MRPDLSLARTFDEVVATRLRANMVESCNRFRDRKLLGAVDCGGPIEFVFESTGAEANLLTLFPDGRVAVGQIHLDALPGYLGRGG